MSRPKEDKRIEVQTRGVVVRRTVGFPKELDDWLESQARKEYRSVSGKVWLLVDEARRVGSMHCGQHIEGFGIEYEKGGKAETVDVFINARRWKPDQDPREVIGDAYTRKHPGHDVKIVRFVHAGEIGTVGSEWLSMDLVEAAATRSWRADEPA